MKWIARELSGFVYQLIVEDLVRDSFWHIFFNHSNQFNHRDKLQVFYTIWNASIELLRGVLHANRESSLFRNT